jgi:hypothetical protein
MAERNDVDDEGQDDLAWVDEGDILADALTVEEPVDDSFNFPNQVCSHCDGYYGPCFGQHTCTTCHLFLFPDNINQPPEANFSEVSILMVNITFTFGLTVFYSHSAQDR